MKEQRYITTLQGNKYIIDTILGSGGFGNTYLATHAFLGRKVAIKEFFMKEYCDRDQTTSHVIVHTDSSRQIVERYKQKFLKEAQMIASLKNEHIIQIHDIFEENDTAYYVMEYVDGGSLKDKVESEGPLSEAEALTYICQVGEALSYLHSNNILHLDVKPANILLDKSNRAILIDFGISKHYDEVGGQTSTTPAGISKGYAPLEQYKQDAITQFNPSTDVYSLGASLYFLLTGKNPPDATDIYEDGLPAMPATITEATRQAILAAMRPRRKDRPQSVSEFIKSFNYTDLQAKPVITGEKNSVKEEVIESAEETVIVHTDSVYSEISNKEETVAVFKETCSKDNEKKKPKSKLQTLLGIAALIILAIIFTLPNNESDNTENVTNKIKTPKLVDMGVSVLWADRNVGASEVYDYGINYNWGITDISGNSKQSSDFNPTGKSISGGANDIATVNYGNGWHIPTWDEYIELTNNCEIYTYTENGVSGYLLVSKINNNKLFFPNYKRNESFAGTEHSVFASDEHPAYWTGSCLNGSGFVYYFVDYKCAYNHNFRLPIRAVKAK